MAMATGILVAVMAPAAASAEEQDRVWVDAVCYDGHGQVMDQAEGYPSLAHWLRDWATMNRDLDPVDRMDGVCTEPLHVLSISLVEPDGSLVVLYEAPARAALKAGMTSVP